MTKFIDSNFCFEDDCDKKITIIKNNKKMIKKKFILNQKKIIIMIKLSSFKNFVNFK